MMSRRKVVASAFENTVVIAAANSWDGVRMADRQLAEALSAHVPVLYVDPPMSVMTRRRQPAAAAVAAAGRLRVLRPGLARLVPEALPGLTRKGVAAVNVRLLAAQIRRAVMALGGSLDVVIDARVLAPIIGRCGERLSVYWAQDDFVGLAPLLGLNADRLRRGERRMSRVADVIIAANPHVARSMEHEDSPVELIPFGCDYENFAKASVEAPDVTLTKPMAVFMGHVGDRIDAALLGAIADRGTNLLVVGPQHHGAHMAQFAEILDRPNVQWVGSKDFEELPSYLMHAAVGILPYNHSRFNIGSFPLKTLEYLAAGLPVVASDLPAIRWLDSPDITIANDPAGFADAVDRQVYGGRDMTGDSRRRDFARQHTWAARATEFARILETSRAAESTNEVETARK